MLDIKKYIGVIWGLMLAVTLMGCMASEPDQTVEEILDRTYQEIKVESHSINREGRLGVQMAAKKKNNPKGENLSPALNFEPVEGASCYAIYMIDKTAHNWLHWRVTVMEAKSLEEGTFKDVKEYIGPYPPKGKDHSYQIEVYALKELPSQTIGKMDASNSYVKMVKALDETNGSTGNILGYGTIMGYYRQGDTNK